MNFKSHKIVFQWHGSNSGHTHKPFEFVKKVGVGRGAQVGVINFRFFIVKRFQMVCVEPRHDRGDAEAKLRKKSVCTNMNTGGTSSNARFFLLLRIVNYTFFISHRLATSTEGQRRSPAVAVAVTAVALCTAVMLAAIAIVDGFSEQIRNKMLGFNSSITVYASGTNEGGIDSSGALDSLLQALPFVVDYGPDLVVPGVIKTPEDFHGVYVKGLSSPTDSAFVADNVVAGAIPPLHSVGSNELVITQSTADKLNLKLGDATDVFFLADDIHMRRMRVGAIVNTHFDAFDNLHAYAPLEAVRNMTGLPADAATSIRIHTKEFDNISSDAMELRRALAMAMVQGRIDRDYEVSTVLDQSAAYFSWLKLLDTNVAVILALMTIVAAATLISAMLIIILDKVAQIGTLKALGVPNAAIGRVFVWIALRVCLLGLAIGNAIALIILEIQKHTHFLQLDPDAYYIDFVPVHLNWPSILLLNVGILVASWLALVLPSRIVASIKPDKSMRFD